MKFIIMPLTMGCLILAASLALAQTKAPEAVFGTGTHGGDPRVAEFIGLANYVCISLRLSPDLNGYSAKCMTEVKDIADSVNLEGRVPRIWFINDDVSDSKGTPKDVVTDLATRTIHGSIDRWNKDTVLERMSTVAMELSLLLEIPRRYDVGGFFLRNSSIGNGPSNPLRTLPAGTRLVATNYIVVPAKYYGILFINGEVRIGDPSGADQASIFRQPNLAGRGTNGCFLGLVKNGDRDNDNARKITEVTFAISDTWNVNGYFAYGFQFVTLKSLAKIAGAFGCWGTHNNGSPYFDQRVTVADFFTAIGSNFNVILPPPDET
jgi:hypothetical protein